jgi:hypothetical protein
MALDGFDYGRDVLGSWVMFVLFWYGFRPDFYVYVCGILCHQWHGMKEEARRGHNKPSQDALATILTLLSALARTATEHSPSPFPPHSPLSFSEQLFHFHFHPTPLLSPILFPTYHIRCLVCTTIQQRPSCLREQ